MPARPNSLSLSLILLLVSPLFFTIEARTLNAAKHHISIDKKIVKVCDESCIEDIETKGLRGGIKNSGATSVLYIGDIKIGGPSAVGKGGELVTDPPSPSKINHSGPSPGDGH